LARNVKLAPLPFLGKEKLSKGVEVMMGIIGVQIEERSLLEGQVVMASHFLVFLIIFNYDI